MSREMVIDPHFIEQFSGFPLSSLKALDSGDGKILLLSAGLFGSARECVASQPLAPLAAAM